MDTKTYPPLSDKEFLKSMFERFYEAYKKSEWIAVPQFTATPFWYSGIYKHIKKELEIDPALQIDHLDDPKNANFSPIDADCCYKTLKQQVEDVSEREYDLKIPGRYALIAFLRIFADKIPIGITCITPMHKRYYAGGLEHVNDCGEWAFKISKGNHIYYEIMKLINSQKTTAAISEEEFAKNLVEFIKTEDEYDSDEYYDEEFWDRLDWLSNAGISHDDHIKCIKIFSDYFENPEVF